MGCGSSRAVIVPSDCNIKSSRNSAKGGPKATSSEKNSRGSLQADRYNNVNSQGFSITDLDEGLGKKREISASSTRTADSGISELPDENIITEHSNPNKLIEVGGSGRPKTPDLVLEGIACPRKQSGKEKRRLELQKKNSESSVPKLPPLENNSLIERPKTRGGMAFDITFCPETGNMKKAQLPKLERRKKKKKLTKEELEEKMRKATERRQQHTRKIQEKSHAFLQQYENAIQRRNIARESNNTNEKNLDNTKDDVTEIVKISENEEMDVASQ